MFWKMLLVIGLLYMVGCASIEYNPKTGKVSYSRIGDQQIQGFEVRQTKDGLIIKMDKQQSEADALAEAIKVIGILSVK